jgi:uncharacterized protein YprB with RNaseH-like and TPR domain
MNPWNMKKVEMQLFLTGHCKHGHSYVTHPKCYDSEIGRNPRIGVFDIETAWGFKADTGFMICYVIKEYGKEKYYEACLTKEDVDLGHFKLDTNVVKHLVDDMKRFDVLITFNGSRFDIPYSRTRALKHKFDFPKYGDMKHIDLYYIVKYKLKLGHNSLESACRLFDIKGKNHLVFDIWQRAGYGDEKALAYILNHCRRDVGRCTELLYNKIIDYARKTNRSI